MKNKEITEKELKRTVGKLLFNTDAPPQQRYENKKPTREELNTKFKLKDK